MKGKVKKMSSVNTLPQTGTEVGQYLDPTMVDTAAADVIDPIHPSWGAGVMSLRPVTVEIPLTNGQTAIVDEEGLILEIR